MYSYIHIPFCESKCDYCRFASYAGINPLKINFYVDFLCREIENSVIKQEKLKSVYFGGGTPTTLSSEQLKRILKTLRKKFGFMEDIEITLETTPENIADHLLNDWKSIGINRISMGVQTLNEETLQEISRKPSEEIFKALGVLEKGVISNISIDFIIGLPFVKVGELQSSIKKVLDIYTCIKHVSVYMLEDYYEAAEDLDSKFQNIKYPVNWSKDGLKEEEFLEEYTSIKSFLKSQGFGSYEISNFSKKGFECEHNKAYWNHSQVAAFGLGASGLSKGSTIFPFVSSMNGTEKKCKPEENKIFTRYKNSDNFEDYYKGQNIEYDILSQEDRILEKIMFGLRTNGFDISILKFINTDNYNKLKKLNLLEEREGKAMLGKKAYVLLNSIIVELSS